MRTATAHRCNSTDATAAAAADKVNRAGCRRENRLQRSMRSVVAVVFVTGSLGADAVRGFIAVMAVYGSII